MGELLDILTEEGFKQEIIMTLDSCFSAEWCFTARELWQKNNYPFRLTILSMCTRENPVILGSYTTKVVKNKEKDFWFRVKRYSQEHGYTTFSGHLEGKCMITEYKSQQFYLGL